MNNRPTFFPIFLTATLAIQAGLMLPAFAEPGVPVDGASSSTPTVAPAPVAPPAASAPADSAAEISGSTYTVVAGDSLWLIAQKCHTSVKKLKALNKLPNNKLKPGQVLQIPPSTKIPEAAPTPAVSPAAPPAPTEPVKPSADANVLPTMKLAKHHKVDSSSVTSSSSALRAQPVQDFDIPASTFASCPVPPPSGPDGDAPVKTQEAGAVAETSAHTAKLVSPEELTKDEATQVTVTTEPVPTPVKAKASAAVKQPVVAEASVPVQPAADVTPPPAHNYSFTSSSSKSTARGLFSSAPRLSSNSSENTAANDWATRFLTNARQLVDQGISYAGRWRPPGESESWVMDCSNTSRYLYKVTTGIKLPRTASDQYYYLHLQNKAWDVPETSSGSTDLVYLRENLKVGDLLFWENTYKPERQPPITHVMIFLGTNDKGEWIMAGSQSSKGGEHNRRRGGPDIYVFDPNKPSGGYRSWLGLVRHQGRFCAYGRPLEADLSKLTVANN